LFFEKQMGFLSRFRVRARLDGAPGLAPGLEGGVRHRAIGAPKDPV
jgi:hypothetical protein